MTQESHHYLWLQPAEPELTRLRELINSLSETHGTSRFEPHLTLVSRLHGPLVMLSERIATLARNSRPFSLAGIALDYNDEFYRCLILKVVPSPPLIALYQQAMSGLPNSDQSVFEPHISLMYGDLSNVRKRGIVTELHGNYPQTVTIDRLVLYSAEGAPEDWRLVQQFTLGR